KLAGLGAHQGAFGANDVADVPALERVVGFAQRILLQEQLDGTRAILHAREAGLAHHALAEQAARHFYPPRLRSQGLGFVLQIARQRVRPEIVGERNAPLAQPAQFLAAFRDQLVFVGGNWLRRIDGFWHFAYPWASARLAPASNPIFKLASMNSSRSPSSTRWVSVRSIPVRKSLMRDWSST